MTRMRAAASSRPRLPVARRMWSIRSQGVGHAGGPAVEQSPTGPCTSSERSASLLGQAVEGAHRPGRTAERAPLGVELFDGQDPLSRCRGHARHVLPDDLPRSLPTGRPGALVLGASR